MASRFKITIGNAAGASIKLFYDVESERIDGGARITDKQGVVGVLMDSEVQMCALVGLGPTPVTAVLMAHLVDSKFHPAN